MSSNVTKRTLSAGLGVGALALLAPRASADTPFLSFAFPATGAPTARTLPDRLGELKNVKDFGARGNGSTNDTAAFQAAVNRGGTIFIPAGVYNISSPIMINGPEAGVRLLGDFPIVQWAGSNAGWMINRNGGGDNAVLIVENILFRNMAWWLGPENGCIRFVDARRLTVRDCYFESRNCIKADFMPEVAGGGIHATAIERCHFRGVTGPSITDSSRNWGNDSTAIEINGYAITCIDNVDLNGFNKAISVPNGNATVKNARIEMVDHGIYGGGLILENLQMEANFINFIWLVGTGSMTARNVFCLADGWENATPALPDGVGVTDGIRLDEWTDVYLENVTVTGFYSSSAIRFDAAADRAPKGVFIKVFAEANKSRPQNANSVNWKNFVTNSKLTFIQCNNP
jgi:hypothetical protein